MQPQPVAIENHLPNLARILAAGGGDDYALEFLNQVLTDLPVAISIYDASDEQFRVLYLNPAVESFAGRVNTPVSQRPVLDVYPEAIQNKVIELFRKTLGEGPQHLRDFVSHTARHYDVDAYRVDGPNGKPYLVLVAQEITELMAANLAKAQFMNMAAHELRTPLSVIKGYLSMLRDGTFGEVPAGWSVYLDTIAAKTVELDHLVDSVLTAARLEGTTLSANPAINNLRAIVKKCVEKAQPRASLMGATVIGDGLDGPPALVNMAEEHAQRVVDNLINNALTYSGSPGWVRVSLELTEHEVIVVVEDRGRGIPPHEHQRIFDQFVRIEDPEFGYPAGSGLGLYISKRLAGLYGGNVELRHSEINRGSTFGFRVPLLTDATEPSGPPDLA